MITFVKRYAAIFFILGVIGAVIGAIYTPLQPAPKAVPVIPAIIKPEKDLFFRYNDSFNLNIQKSMHMILSRRHDSAMYYNGKSAAYLEMESSSIK